MLQQLLYELMAILLKPITVLEDGILKVMEEVQNIALMELQHLLVMPIKHFIYNKASSPMNTLLMEDQVGYKCLK